MTFVLYSSSRDSTSCSLLFNSALSFSYNLLRIKQNLYTIYLWKHRKHDGNLETRLTKLNLYCTNVFTSPAILFVLVMRLTFALNHRSLKSKTLLQICIAWEMRGTWNIRTSLVSSNVLKNIQFLRALTNIARSFPGFSAVISQEVPYYFTWRFNFFILGFSSHQKLIIFL
jgi:hypothetical protein